MQHAARVLSEVQHLERSPAHRACTWLQCRYYYRSTISDSCIANYCTDWFSEPADQDYPSYGSECYCCRFFEHLADKSNTSASSCDSANTVLKNSF